MRLSHVQVMADDLEAMRAFFVEVLGFEVGPRPAFGFPGYWLYSEGRDLIHLRGREATEPWRPGPEWSNPIDHVALSGDGAFEALVERLERFDATYRAQTVPGSGVRQVFVLGPEGVKVELQFDPA